MIKFIGYLIKYRKNTLKLSRMEQEIENLKNESEFYENKAVKSNNALRQIYNLLTEYEKDGKFYAPIYCEIKEIVENNVEKKLSDEIFSHYSSNNK
jgi:hypothetical protein